MIKRSVIALAGVSGVGKTTLLRDAGSRLVFEHLQAGDLIKEARQERQDQPIAHDLLREENVADNQTLLISSFKKRAPEQGLVILDCHTIVDTPDGLVEIPPSVFAALDVCRFVVLVDEVESISFRRLCDTQRKRPSRSYEELAAHQGLSVIAAYRAALALAVPVFVVPLGARPDIGAFLDW